MLAKRREKLEDFEVHRAAEARQLREQAEMLPPGPLREQVLRRAKDVEDDYRE